MNDDSDDGSGGGDGNIVLNIITIHIQGPPKKCIHTLTKENSMLYVRTKFNYTSQVTIEHNTSFLYLYS
jgi:hypothetical protein